MAETVFKLVIRKANKKYEVRYSTSDLVTVADIDSILDQLPKFVKEILDQYESEK